MYSEQTLQPRLCGAYALATKLGGKSVQHS